MSPRIGGLFEGYSGLTMAVESVYGGSLAWYSEIDKGALKILTHRYPDVLNVGDVTAVKWTPDCPECGELLALYWVGEDAHRAYWCREHGEFPLSLRDPAIHPEPVDILTGGSPCQDLSHAGKRAGMTEGTRSNLWVAMREAIAQLRPAVVVWENVRGAYSAAADSALESEPGLLDRARRRDGEPVLRALGRVLGDLSDLGYDARWHGLRAADVGAPHGRFRVFVVATDATHYHRNGRADTGATGGREGVSDTGACKWCADGLQIICGHGPASDSSRLRRRAGRPAGADQAPSGRASADPSGRDLLPTPRATDGTKGGPNQRGSSGDLMLPSAVALLGTPRASEWKGCGPVGSKSHAHRLERDYLDAQVLELEAQRLLPTPTTTQRGADANLDTREGARANLHNEVARLLPTPSAMAPDAKVSDRARDLYSSGDRLGDIVEQARWGDYAAAIARWEHILGRPAPAPTMTSSKGNPQLAPAFVEWMMGLPADWVTDAPGITRNEALKALGNGVVPQQAAHAVRVMASWAEVAA